MKIHNLVQGTPEWHAFRALMDTASEASAVMGVSTSTTRNELVRLKATGNEKEFSAWVQKNLLDKGHAIEAKARKLAAKEVGQPLYPCTASSDDYPRLAASFDGATMDESLIAEIKSWNEEKAAKVREGEVPEQDYWQVVQQLIVSRAERALYMVTDGTPERTVSCWLTLNKRDETLLLKSWARFNLDVAEYTPTEAKPEVVAAHVAGLPAITYKLNGLALTSNLANFRKAAEQAVIDSKKELTTDQDFADRDALNKSFADAETKIKLMREQVIGEVGDIDKFTRELAEIGELIRQARLAGEKAVTTRKEQIKSEIRLGGVQALADYVAKHNKALEHVQLPIIPADFAGAMKGKRTLDSLQNAVDTVLAKAKIVADDYAALYGANLAVLAALPPDHKGLFRDFRDLVTKPTETLELIVKDRITEHVAEVERARVAAEEKAKADAAAAALKAAEVVPAAVAEPVREQPTVREPDLLDTTQEVGETLTYAPSASAPVSPAKPERCEVVNMLALLKAVVAGEVPHDIVDINVDRLEAFCRDTGYAAPGTTWAKV